MMLLLTVSMINCPLTPIKSTVKSVNTDFHRFILGANTKKYNVNNIVFLPIDKIK